MSSTGVFKISEAAALALHGAVFLAERPDEPCTTAGLAERLGASEHHMAKVMQRLGKARLVRSVRGPRGGFRLARPAEKITLLEVYEAIDGPMTVTGCLFDRPRCCGRFCILGGLIRSLEEQTLRYFEKTSLADVNRQADSIDCSGS